MIFSHFPTPWLDLLAFSKPLARQEAPRLQPVQTQFYRELSYFGKSNPIVKRNFTENSRADGTSNSSPGFENAIFLEENTKRARKAPKLRSTSPPRTPLGGRLKLNPVPPHFSGKCGGASHDGPGKGISFSLPCLIYPVCSMHLISVGSARAARTRETEALRAT